MDMQALREQVQRFDPETAIAAAHTPPAAWYLEPEFLALEREAVFDRNWIAVAPLEDLAQPGCTVAGRLLDRPWVVARGGDGVLRAFHGACRHHAAELLSGCARLEQITCPYHGWTYALDGSLASAPRMAGVAGFDRAAMGLPPIALDTWGGWVFLHFGGRPRALAPGLQRLGERLAASSGVPLRHVAQRRSLLQCNWKVFVDNYLDGGYHVSRVHPELAEGLQLETYTTEAAGRCVFQGCAATGGRLGRDAFYAWVHPNLMFNRYGPVLDVNRVLPLAPARTEVVFDFYFEEPAASDGAFVERCIAASERVQAEDVRISEAVQRGLSSPGYDCGRYAPSLETGAHLFHRLLAGELREALSA